MSDVRSRIGYGQEFVMMGAPGEEARRWYDARAACLDLKCRLVTWEEEHRSANVYSGQIEVWWERNESPEVFYENMRWGGDSRTGRVRNVTYEEIDGQA